MSKIGQKREIRYKSYDQNLQIDLPILLEELVKENSLVQIINEVVEHIELRELDRYYSRRGCPAYDPRMMIKVWIYGYCSQVYTSRPLAQKLREDLGFMWLAGGQQPCFKTLSDFRSKRMQGLVDKVFEQVLKYLVDQEYVNLNDLYIDGSKWEADGNRYKAIWRKNTERYKARVEDRIRDLLDQINELQRQEDNQYGKSDLRTHESESEVQIVLKSSELKQHIKELNEVIKQKQDDPAKSVRRLNKKLSKEAEKLEKYEKQQVLLQGRNSYSKTDTDATFMRLKDDLLRPAYNVQISTSNQYIVNTTIHQNASDSVTLTGHLEELEKRLGNLIEPTWQPDATLDAGYGSEENYALLESKNITAYMKYPSWYQEKTGELAKKKYRRENWFYDPVEDYYLCPANKKLPFVEHRQVKTINGYERCLSIYECESCAGCAFFTDCRGEKAHPQSNRRVQRSKKLETYKEQAKTLLASEQGKVKRKQRSVDVETPFGDIKYNRGHKRFYLRSIEKVRVEFSLLAMAHNFRKIHCQKSGIWKEYYAQRAAKKLKMRA